LWWYNRVPRPAIDPLAAGEELAGHLSSRLASAGRTLHLLDLTTDLGMPAVAAISARHDGSAVAFGFGAGLQVERAARRALLEMQQVLGAFEADQNLWIDRWIAGINLHREPWLAPAADARAAAGCVSAEGQPELARCVEMARRSGLEMLAANLTRPGVDIPTARVIVPGLRPAFPRFAPGRIYDAPCALGWRKEPLPEGELNPFPFFL
jgi:ribosomal protein S12 methylthiotransferase accessory factor